MDAICIIIEQYKYVSVSSGTLGGEFSYLVGEDLARGGATGSIKVVRLCTRAKRWWRGCWLVCQMDVWRCWLDLCGSGSCGPLVCVNLIQVALDHCDRGQGVFAH